MQDAARGMYGRNRDYLTVVGSLPTETSDGTSNPNPCMTIATIRYVLSFLPWGKSPLWSMTSALSRFHDNTQTHHTRQYSSGRVISATQETSTWEHKALTRDGHPSLAGFPPAVPVRARPQTYALGRATTGIGWQIQYTPTNNRRLYWQFWEVQSSKYFILSSMTLSLKCCRPRRPPSTRCDVTQP